MKKSERMCVFLHAHTCLDPFFSFNLVDVLVAAIVARPWQALRILVREARGKAFHHRAAGEILRGNQLQAIALTILFLDVVWGV